jgi:hypothetical protein
VGYDVIPDKDNLRMKLNIFWQVKKKTVKRMRPFIELARDGKSSRFSFYPLHDPQKKRETDSWDDQDEIIMSDAVFIGISEKGRHVVLTGFAENNLAVPIDSRTVKLCEFIVQ